MRVTLTGLVLTVALVPATAAADVTLKTKSSTSNAASGNPGEMTQYVKGTRLRVDSSAGGRRTSTIIDAKTHQIVMLDHDNKTARTIDMAAMSGQMSQMGMSDIQTSITPTTETRQVAGATCTVYDVKVSVPMQMGGQTMTMSMSGPQCLSKTAPGRADFSAFYDAAAANGGFFMDPTQAKAQPAMAKAMADLQKRMADLGIPLATETTIGMAAEGPMADMMKKMSTTVTTEVTSISTEPIADSVFEVPAGYTTVK